MEKRQIDVGNYPAIADQKAWQARERIHRQNCTIAVEDSAWLAGLRISWPPDTPLNHDDEVYRHAAKARQNPPLEVYRAIADQQQARCGR